MDTQNKTGFSIERKFNAPKTAVFNAFATAEALGKWWGPAGSTISVINFNFKPEGIFHYKLDGNGQTMWGLFVYKNISSPDLLEFVSSFSDENANVCKAPFPMDFPLQIFNQVTLTENNGITTLLLQGHPINATPEQEATYKALTESMQQGFGGTFNQLENYLKTV